MSPLNFTHILTQAVDELSESESYKGLFHQHKDGEPLPSAKVLYEIIELSRSILFPGYYGNSTINSRTINYHIGVNIEKLFDLLCEQILAGLCFSTSIEGKCNVCSDSKREEAARLAIRSPLLDNVNIMNAKGVLINITGGADITLRETEIITDVVNQIVDLDEGEVFFGTVFDQDARDEIRVTVIATGLTRNANEAEPKRRPSVSSSSNHFQQQATQNAVVEEDDVPAISKRQHAEEPVAASTAAPRSAPMSIQDYLKNQQRK